MMSPLESLWEYAPVGIPYGVSDSMNRPRQLLSLMALLGSLPLLGGCEESSSGACDGTIDGEVFNLRVYNCLNDDIYVQVNDRNVGIVDAYDAETELCGATNLGSFPQCSTTEITVTGYELVGATFEWDDSAMQNSSNGCWIMPIYGKIDGVVLNPDAELPSMDPAVDLETQGCKNIIVNDPSEE